MEEERTKKSSSISRGDADRRRGSSTRADAMDAMVTSSKVEVEYLSSGHQGTLYMTLLI